jgi:hypothetical protein
MVYYFDGTGGGVWKSSDGGINWETDHRWLGIRHRLSQRDWFI